MVMTKTARRVLLLASACSTALLISPASATDVVITSGTTNANNVLLGGADTLTVQTNATTTNSAGSAAAVSQFSNTTGAGIVITNNGTIANTRTGSGPSVTYLGPGKTYALDGFSTIWGTGTTIYTGNIAITNTGSITSVGGPAIFFAPQATGTTFVNSGTVSAGGGYKINSTAVDSGQSIAIAFGSGTNVFTNNATGVVNGNIILGTGTNIVNLVVGNVAGRIDGTGSSNNTINLSGSGNGLAYGQSEGTTFKGWDGIQTLNVNSGNWKLTGGGYYNNVNIASGASFLICDLHAASSCGDTSHGTPTDGGIGPLTSSVNIVLNGLMTTQSGDGKIYYDPTSPEAFKVTGTGQFLIQNTAGTGGYVGPASNLSGFAGTTIVDGGAFILGTTIGGDVQINPNGILQFGSGGNLKNVSGVVVDNGKVGNVLGNIVDNGTLVFNRLDDFTYAGNLSGSGNIIKANANTVTLSGQYTYVGRTQIRAGAIVLAPTAKLSTVSALDVSGGSISLGGTTQTVAGLSSTDGNSGTINMASGTLTVNQTTASTFNGTIAGAGTVQKTGSATLILDGNNSGKTGTTSISGGLLEVGDASNPGASLGGSVTVVAGGALGGHGTITGSVANAGTTAPGGSIGTLHVVGNYAFGDGSLLQEEVAANGTADLTQSDALVSIGSNATVLVMPTDAATSYQPITTYTIITGGTGVSGTFQSVSSSVNGLTPVLRYTGNSVSVILVRNDIDLTPLAKTVNQTQVARALGSGQGGEAYVNVVLNGAAAAGQALDALSGEVHSTLANALLNDGGFLADLIGSRDRVEAEGLRIWGAENSRWAHLGGSSAAAAGNNQRLGAGMGADLPVRDNLRVGAALAYARDQLGVAGRSSTANADTIAGSLYADLDQDKLTGTFGIGYAIHNIGTARSIIFPGVSQNVSSSYDGHSLSSFGELRYRLDQDDLDLGGIAAEPFASFNATRLWTGPIKESGGSAALTGAASGRSALFTKLGSRFSKSYDLDVGSIIPRASLAWEHDLSGTAQRQAFNFTGSSQFSVAGAPLSRDDLALEAGFGLEVGKFALNLSYAGRQGGNTTENGVDLTVQLAF